MARKKRQWLDDDLDSSDGSEGGDIEPDDNDPDLQAERELFQNPYQRGNKRRKFNGKDDAIYGVLGEDDEDEGFGGRKRSGKGAGRERVDWTKAPSFVGGEIIKPDIEKEIEEAEEEQREKEHSDPKEDLRGQIDEDGGSDESEEESEPSEPKRSPRIIDEEYEEDEEEAQPTVRSGFGAAKSMAAQFGLADTSPSLSHNASPTETPFPRRGGIGSSKLGGSTKTETSLSEASTSFAAAGLPSAFGTPDRAPDNESRRPQRSFLRDGGGPSSAAKPVNLSTEEKRHFNKLQGSFGAKLLEKMGWQTGTGLGAQSQGIVTPIETKLRPGKIGIAFKGFKEKTEQSKAEARRRGEVVSDDDEPRRSRGKGKATDRGPKSDAWKEPKKIKTRVVHKTYEQIVQEAGGELPASGVGTIIDATGATPREISIADISTASWTPSTDPTRLPEVRHNLRLISDVAKGDLAGLAREAKTLAERKKWIDHEDTRLRKAVADEAELIARLQKVHLIAEDITAQAKQAAGLYEPSLDMFSSNFDKLLIDYSVEYDKYHLDEIVVGAISPVIRRSLTQWNPLDDPAVLTSHFRRWRKAFKMSVVPVENNKIEVYGVRSVTNRPPQSNPEMTPYESLMWNVWLPKVRSTVNNDWAPSNPLPLIQLIEAWSDLLPQFIYDNMMDQLILPKLQKAVADWKPVRDQVPLQAMVFPWLPFVGLRVEDVVSDARRKIKSLLRAWAVDEGIPTDIIPWKDVFNAADWEGMLLKYVVPKLGATLRDDFKINPRNQNMQPLEWVLPWAAILRPSTFSHLLEAEFFPKWLDILHLWLVSPNPSFDEVAQWYSFWKSAFPDAVRELPQVANGFTQGLQLMNKAVELGPLAPRQLQKPHYRDLLTPEGISASGGGTPGPVRARPLQAEVTFRSVVEEFAASHNLLFIPTGRSHEKSRMPLFRVSQNLDGKGGVTVYILDDAVWAPDGDDYRAITLDEMVLRATKGKT